MKRSVLLVLFLVLAAPCLEPAQAQAAPPLKPGPEIQRLGFWVGTWKYESANASGMLTYEWITGGFGVIGREEGTDRAGRYAHLRVMTFDPEERVYTFYAVNNRGPGGSLAKITLAGNTWHGEWKATIGGKPAAFRGDLVEVTPALVTWKVERSVDGGPWTATTDGKYTRVK
jgi:hypothetical protein